MLQLESSIALYDTPIHECTLSPAWNELLEVFDTELAETITHFAERSDVYEFECPLLNGPSHFSERGVILARAATSGDQIVLAHGVIECGHTRVVYVTQRRTPTSVAILYTLAASEVRYTKHLTRKLTFRTKLTPNDLMNGFHHIQVVAGLLA